MQTSKEYIGDIRKPSSAISAKIGKKQWIRKTRDLFKKIRSTKGTFHSKMGKIKDRNGMDLTEAEDIKKMPRLLDGLLQAGSSYPLSSLDLRRKVVWWYCFQGKLHGKLVLKIQLCLVQEKRGGWYQILGLSDAKRSSLCLRFRRMSSLRWESGLF